MKKLLRTSLYKLGMVSTAVLASLFLVTNVQAFVDPVAQVTGSAVEALASRVLLTDNQTGNNTDNNTPNNTVNQFGCSTAGVASAKGLSNSRVRVTFNDSTQKTFKAFKRGSGKPVVRVLSNGHQVVAVRPNGQDIASINTRRCNVKRSPTAMPGIADQVYVREIMNVRNGDPRVMVVGRIGDVVDVETFRIKKQAVNFLSSVGLNQTAGDVITSVKTLSRKPGVRVNMQSNNDFKVFLRGGNANVVNL